LSEDREDILDNYQEIRKIDAQGMLEIVEDFSNQCIQAVEIAKGTDFSRVSGPFSCLLVQGVGGSGVSGDLVKALVEETLEIPFLVNKRYGTPGFVDESTLAFAVSYSGNTEETLIPLRDILFRGAELICLTSGGQLADFARQNGKVLIELPGGLQPRAAIGYLFLPLLLSLSELGIFKIEEADLEESFEVLSDMAEELAFRTPARDNQAKKLATLLWGKLPIVYGSEGISGAAALRWKCQFNENSKIPSFWNNFPELNHNETVGWELLKDITRRFALVLLEDERGRVRNVQRMGITKELVKKQFGLVTAVKARGESPLARLLSLIYLGDVTSVYLAILNEVDPTPVERIRVLKENLARLG
jgi:glucose/mannose-6-phosphate isomerase